MSLHDAVGAKLFGAGSPLELSEEEIGWRDGVGAPHQAGVRHKVFPRLAQNLADWYQLPAARGFLEREFLVLDGQRLTFGETLSQAAAVGAWLVQSCGVRRGDRVGICMRNCPEYCIAFIAATSVGACCVPLNSLWTQKELEYGLENSGTTVLFCDTERLKLAVASLGALPGLRRLVAVQHPARDLVGEGGGLVQHWDEVLSSHAGRVMPTFPCHKDDNAVLMYTSGTTGFPKGVVLTHRGITHALNAAVAHGALEKAVAAVRAGKSPASALAPSEEDKAQQVTLLAVPLFHATGLHAVFLVSFIVGRKIVFMHKWAPERALQLIEQEKVTSFTGVPTMVLNMLEHPNRTKYDTRSLQSMGGGGAPPPPSMVREVGSKFKAAPTQGFGMTETNAIVCLNQGESYVQRPTSCGRAVPGVTVEIWDDNSRKVPPETVGRVMIKGASIMKEYWRSPEATAETITREGYLETGDVGRMDKEGYVYIMDRSKDLIIRGGENISASEVEAAVYEHPGVSECSVVAVPHPTLQEEVGVAVYPRKGFERMTLSDLLGATQSLAAFKRPAHLFIYSEPLPRGATGKLLKKQVKEDIKSGKLKKTISAKL